MQRGGQLSEHCTKIRSSRSAAGHLPGSKSPSPSTRPPTLRINDDDDNDDDTCSDDDSAATDTLREHCHASKQHTHT